ncbi:MAG TPA: carboxypeptidase regulatory-like domain-containing protein [Longimicrobiaceae bacterium]
MTLLAAPPLLAQQRAEPERVKVAGRVVEATTGKGVSGAMVAFPRLEARTVTDAEGRFAFARLPEGEQSVEVSRIGYVGTRDDVWVAGGDSLFLAVLARPVVLEALTVTENRVERRSLEAPYGVRAVGGEQMKFLAGIFSNTAELAVSHLGIVRCSRPGTDTLESCALVRGRERNIHVYIDDIAMRHGMEMLEMSPSAQISRVEWFPGFGMLRVYTNGFMQDVAAGRRKLAPVIWYDAGTPRAEGDGREDVPPPSTSGTPAPRPRP